MQSEKATRFNQPGGFFLADSRTKSAIPKKPRLARFPWMGA
jgi:hypothetical protein